MNKETVKKLEQAHKWCDDNNKSTEFLIQYLQDFANVDIDTAITYLINCADE